MKVPTKQVSFTHESLAQLAECQRILADRAGVPTEIPASQVIRMAIQEMHLRLTTGADGKNPRKKAKPG